MKTINAKKSRVPLSKLIERVGNILYSGRNRAFTEDELQHLAGEGAKAADVRNALVVLKRGNSFRQDAEGRWCYCGRF